VIACGRVFGFVLLTRCVAHGLRLFRVSPRPLYLLGQIFGVAGGDVRPAAPIRTGPVPLGTSC
jgi:hypothetical protein